MVTLKDINLVPKSVIVKRENTKFVKSIMIVAAVVIGISAVVDGAGFLIKKSYSDKVIPQKAEIEKLLGSEEDINAMKAIGQKIQYREDIIKKIDDSNMKVTKLLDTIEKIMPKDVNITSMNIKEDGEVLMQGNGAKEESVLDFYHDLKTSNVSDYIKFNTLTGTLGDSNKGYDFTFTFKLKGGK